MGETLATLMLCHSDLFGSGTVAVHLVDGLHHEDESNPILGKSICMTKVY